MEQLTILSYISIVTLFLMYVFLISEKINKVLVVGIASSVLILGHVFHSSLQTPQEVALEFVSKNLDVLGFIIGMMVLVGVIKESGIFEAIAIWIVKKVRGNPVALMIAIGYLTLFMTAFLSNIPTVLIIIPVLLILIDELKLPPLPYFFTVIVMANIGGAMTPISDPTTYYQSKTVGLGFMEVVMNSGLIVLVLSIVSMTYIYLVFRKVLFAVRVKSEDVSLFRPRKAIKDKHILYWGTPILFTVIILMILKDYIARSFHIYFDNASLTITGALLAVLLFNRDLKKILQKVIDWEIIFFFSGLFIVVGSLEHNGVVVALAKSLLQLVETFHIPLQFLITFGSGILSTFIDNVPYNIAMVGIVQEMEKAGVYVYPLWWALNLGTSIGGAGSPIGAACNVLAFGQAEKEGIHVRFGRYLLLAFPLVIINATVTFLILYLRYGGKP